MASSRVRSPHQSVPTTHAPTIHQRSSSSRGSGASATTAAGATIRPAYVSSFLRADHAAGTLRSLMN